MRYDLAMTHLEAGKRLNDQDHFAQVEGIFTEIGAEYGSETREFLEMRGQ